MHTPTVAFFGLFGVGNLGNEASLDAAVRAVTARLPDAAVVVVSADPGRTTAEHGIRSVAITMSPARSRDGSRPRSIRLLLRPWRELTSVIRAFRFLRSVDAVIVPGTGILDDFGVRPHQMPFDLLKWSALARLARRPWAFISIGAGPADNRWSRRCFRWSAAMATSCTFRDEGSRDFMARLDRRHRDGAVYPDLAYTLPTPARDGSDPEATAIGVMSYYGWQGDEHKGAALHARYAATLTELVLREQRSGKDVVLLIGDRADRPVADAIMTAASRIVPDASTGSVTCPALDTMTDVLQAVARCDVVAASRFHNVVAALMMQRPVLALGYSAKFAELLHDVGLDGYAHDIEHLDADALEDALNELRRDTPAIAAALARVATDYRARLEQQYDELVAGLGLLPPTRPAAAERC